MNDQSSSSQRQMLRQLAVGVVALAVRVVALAVRVVALAVRVVAVLLSFIIPIITLLLFLIPVMDRMQPLSDWVMDRMQPLSDWVMDRMQPLSDWVMDRMQPLSDWVMCWMQPLSEWVMDRILNSRNWFTKQIPASYRKTLLIALTAFAGYIVTQSLDSLRRNFKEWWETVKIQLVAMLKQSVAILVSMPAIIFPNSFLKFRSESWISQWHGILKVLGSFLRLSRNLIVFPAIFLLVYAYHNIPDGAQPSPQGTGVADGAQPNPQGSAEPIIGLPLLFGRAQGMPPSEDSRGIRLEPSHEEQLKVFMDLLKPLLNSESGPVNLLVIGYASNTPFYINGSRDYNPNVPVANFRAKVVGDFLSKNLGFNCSRMKWKRYELLQECRPYKSPVGLPSNLRLERMNQSVMLYVMKKNGTVNNCIGRADSVKPCDGSS